LGWAGMITGGLAIVDVAGTHNSIMSHTPHIAGLVQRIDDHLRRLPSQLPSDPL
jgi:thioesterase domain-containing protein